MNIGIAGANGYTGEELVRWLARHPGFTLAAVASRSLAGQNLDQHLPALRGHPLGRTPFIAADPAALASREDIGCWFLALPHGVAATFAAPLLAAGRRVIDLSADFRLFDPALYHRYYGEPHPAPELLSQAPYVLPEWTPESSWIDAPLIACPGCYPTSILLPLLPLAARGLLPSRGIVINSFSGISGAGRKAENRLLFAERDESLTPYGLAGHRHLSEIEEQLTLASGSPVVVQFTPHLAPIRRGILSTIVFPSGGLTSSAVRDLWAETYPDCPFVALLPPGRQPDTAEVAWTNRADLAAVDDPRTGNLILTSALDNLVKGAGGQAIQILNRLAGLPTTTGLL